MQIDSRDTKDDVATSELTEPVSPVERTLRIADLFGFLIGRRDSIEKVLHCKRSLYIGAVLVFTAALAREYDAVSLLHRPWDLLGPYGASIVIATLIYATLRIAYWMSGEEIHDNECTLFSRYLAGYWWTGPLAWMYATPIEIMTDEVDALRFNLALLSLVSVWRVLLFSRVASILFRIPYFTALTWILIPCMTIAFFALLSQVMSVVTVMGGLRLTQTQRMVVDFQGYIVGIIFYAFIPNLFAAIAFIIAGRQRLRLPKLTLASDVRLSRSVLVVPAIISCVLLTGICYFQPRLFRAELVNRLLLEDRCAEAIRFMQAQGPDRFPAVWDPPPHFPYGTSDQPAIQSLLNALVTEKPLSWIPQRLLVQADEILFRQIGWKQGTAEATYMKHVLMFEGPEKLSTLSANLNLLASLLSADSNDRAHVGELIAIVEEAKEQAAAAAKDSATKIQ